MSKVCEQCGRGTSVTISRSHSHIATRHKQYINLQSKKIDGARMRICTKCIKSLANKKA